MQCAHIFTATNILIKFYNYVLFLWIHLARRIEGQNRITLNQCPPRFLRTNIRDSNGTTENLQKLFFFIFPFCLSASVHRSKILISYLNQFTNLRVISTTMDGFMYNLFLLRLSTLGLVCINICPRCYLLYDSLYRVCQTYSLTTDHSG